ncbi:unnamed protein product [Symbiodinium pilosum]|uniref:Uncharacterized protein n=1 Tax=Symbiodinium pilosum TaxID=2952 RepID=A0A812L429_SYMPI|nr:unnamed protein product [Symbiodinium pilosum]
MCKDETASAEDAKTALSEKAESKAADIATLSEQLETLERDVAAEKKAITRVDWVVATATKLREKALLRWMLLGRMESIAVMHKAMNSLEKYLDEVGMQEFGFLLESASPGPCKALSKPCAPKWSKSDFDPQLQSPQELMCAVDNNGGGKSRWPPEGTARFTTFECEAADQAAYVQLIEVARKSRRKDAYTLTDFVGGQAALAAESQRIQDRQKALKEQMGLADQLASTLKEECEKLIADYKAKKQARIMEVDVLKNKKAALEASLADVDLE